MPNSFSRESEALDRLVSMPIMQQIASTAKISRIQSDPAGGTYEAAFLGMNPTTVSVADGPLTVAALGAHPPTRSALFHLSFLSCDATGTIQPVYPAPTGTDYAEILSAARRLQTRDLHIVEGTSLDHALVWLEGSIEMKTMDRDTVLKRGLIESLPNGERDYVLRKLIDDSVNLLSDCECNRQREGEGQSPINLLWPWGQGFSVQMPNLTLRYGVPIMIASRSLRVKGMAKLCGLVHDSVEHFSRGLNINWKHLSESLERTQVIVIVADTFSEIIAEERPDIMARACEDFASHFLEPIWNRRVVDPVSLSVLVTHPTEIGIAMQWNPALKRDNHVPFLPLVADDGQIPLTFDWELINHELKCESPPY